MAERNYLFKILVGVSAFVIAGVAAYFSIFGISMLFAGYMIAVIIMAGALEFGKLIAVSYLHRYWKEINLLLKIYLLASIIILMIITSAGIYGFLSNAYQETAHKLTQSEQIVGTIELKQEMFKEQIDQINKRIENKNIRNNILINLRTSQERRLDSLYIKNTWMSQNSTKAIEANIRQANEEILLNENEITELTKKLNSLQDSILALDIKKIDAKNIDAVTELGPLLYLSRLTGKPLDVVVNWFILLLIFVFDPFAISLLIAFNHIIIHAPSKQKFSDLEHNASSPEPIKDNIVTKDATMNTADIDENKKDDIVTKDATMNTADTDEDKKDDIVTKDATMNTADTDENKEEYLTFNSNNSEYKSKSVIVDELTNVNDSATVETIVDDKVENGEDKLYSPSDNITQKENELSVAEKIKLWSDGQIIEEEKNISNKASINQKSTIDTSTTKIWIGPYNKGMRPDGGIST